MERAWRVLFYVSSGGQCPVRQYLDALKTKERAKVVAWISLLRERGINLHRPYADVLEDGIHELRIKVTGDQTRILYFFSFRDYIVLTHVFEKHTDRVPAGEIVRAKKCREDVRARYTAETMGRLEDGII